MDELSFSKNNALTFQKLGTTNYGRVYPGFNPESVFVISEEQESKGSLSYLPSYNKSIANLIVKLEDSGQVVLDSFDLVYTDGQSIFLLLDTNCYKITAIDVISSGLIEEANNFENYFKIYPNPVNEVINICKLNYHSISNTRVKLFNDKLSLINSFDFETDNLQVDTKNLSPGIYYIFFYSNLECKVSKFIKI
ncbi:MAG: T9SS type A sorting domain-containing protein [Saprospiraceae bacterium]|nr:T9SS type A sorting domain-containing protein [Saprospiraceae bacterium]